MIVVKSSSPGERAWMRLNIQVKGLDITYVFMYVTYKGDLYDDD